MDYKKLICRRILDLDPQYDVKKLENHGDRPEVESAFDKGTGDSVRSRNLQKKRRYGI